MLYSYIYTLYMTYFYILHDYTYTLYMNQLYIIYSYLRFSYPQFGILSAKLYIIYLRFFDFYGFEYFIYTYFSYFQRITLYLFRMILSLVSRVKYAYSVLKSFSSVRFLYSSNLYLFTFFSSYFIVIFTKWIYIIGLVYTSFEVAK